MPHISKFMTHFFSKLVSLSKTWKSSMDVRHKGQKKETRAAKHNEWAVNVNGVIISVFATL